MAAGSLALAQLMAGCNSSDASLLRVRVLEGSVPVQLLKEFQRQVAQGEAFDFTASEQLADLYDLLTRWGKPSESGGAAGSTSDSPEPSSSLPFQKPASEPIADLLALGDYWLTSAIQQGLIQPLSLDGTEAWQSLLSQPIWQNLLRRDRQGQPSAEGEIWAAPYRWGSLMIAYRRDRFEEEGWAPPTDWNDLWRSELRRRISLLDSPRSVIGITLKKLGRSINTGDLNAVPELQTELEALQNQVKLYSSTTYLQPLILGDTDVAVGWSTEILPILKRYRQIAVVAPKSGTVLTADVWVRPATAPNLEGDSANRADLLQRWITFFWDQTIATQLSLLSYAASPIFLNTSPAEIPVSLADNPLIPPASVLENSEFLLPLSNAAVEQYRQYWKQMREVVNPVS